MPFVDISSDDLQQIRALFNQAMQASEQGRIDKAERAYRNILAIAPEFPDALHNLALICLRSNREREAFMLLQKAQEVMGNDGDTCMLKNSLAMAYFSMEQFPQAEALLTEVLKENPKYVYAAHNISKVLRRQGRHQEALKYIKMALKQDRNDIEALNSIGAIYAELGNTKKAVYYFKEALKLSPEHFDGVKNLGMALLDAGDIKEGHRYLKKALKLRPDFGDIYLTLVRSDAYKGKKQQEEVIQELERRIARVGHSSAAETNAPSYFAYAEMLAKRKEYDRAFEMYQKGNQLTYGARDYNPDFHLQQFRSVLRFFTPALFKEREGWGNPSEMPIFIMGMPRSGTTLVEQILSSHSKVGGAGEVKYLMEALKGWKNQQGAFDLKQVKTLSEDDFAAAGGRYLDMLRKQVPGAQYITNKMPQNYGNVGFIRLMLPHAKIIHCRRHPLDVVLSIFCQFFAEKGDTRWSFSLESIAGEYRFHHNLMQLWKKLFPGWIHDVVYEKMVDNAEAEARAMVEFCGLPWEDACLNYTQNKKAVRTASVWQVRQGIYQSSRFKWKQYEKHLEPARKMLEPEIEQYEKMLGVEDA